MRQHMSIDITEPAVGVLDFSGLLEAPAGERGFVGIKDGHLCFQDGTRARFIGFNLATRSNTPDHRTAELLADRLASLGVNVVRLHAADAPIGEEPHSWSSCAEAPLIDYSRGTSRGLNPEGLDRFEYLIAALKARGIYLHIDLIVAREFLPDDGLAHNGGVPSCMKRYSLYDERLIELQMEYARELLTHVNPYTGLALVDEPAVMAVQINNEDSAIKGNPGADATEEMAPYRAEVAERFGEFLLQKYGSRERLAQAWTHDGICALGDDEDPAAGTVAVIRGDFYQPVNDLCGRWDGNGSDAVPRYADFMEFGIQVNRQFYRRMKEYLLALGVKVPIVTSNLLAGAADVYGHSDGDLMENNAYFNHPLLPVVDGTYLVAGPEEYVSVNPLTMQRGIGAMATTILSLGSLAAVAGKPFALSEWNEYGVHPFHSTALVQTVAYACLNDWDALILYNHHTSEDPERLPGDEILSVFDSYNDPAVIAQWGFMAEMFLNGRVRPARNRTDLVYTTSELDTLPPFHAMPSTILPYITGMRTVFLGDDEQYRGDADLAVSAGHLVRDNLAEAEHSVTYSWSPYKDVWRRERTCRPTRDAASDSVAKPAVELEGTTLRLHDIAALAGQGDYREVARTVDTALKEWGLLDEGTGYVDGALISDTGEIILDPERSRFTVRTPSCAYASGAPEPVTILSDRVRARLTNERMSLALLPLDGADLASSGSLLLTAVGTTGTDGYSVAAGPELMLGIAFNQVRLDGRIVADTAEGSLEVEAPAARLVALDQYGHEITEIEGVNDGGLVRFALTGRLPALQFHLTIPGRN